MTHPLVKQLRFTRSEFQRALAGLTDEDARRRILPMNCISWNIAHLAGQEQRYWLTRMQGKTLFPHLDELAGYGQPASTPSLDEMLSAWNTITASCDLYLEALTTEILQAPFLIGGRPSKYSLGTVLQRMVYHYWVHIGEILVIRQMLGNQDLPEFVGDLHSQAPYQPN